MQRQHLAGRPEGLRAPAARSFPNKSLRFELSVQKSIKVSRIDIPDGRIRELNEDWAWTIGRAMQECGQETPIKVVANGDRFTLSAGLHRTMGAKFVKLGELDAIVKVPEPGQTAEQTADENRLSEITENLLRKNFNALERCEAFSELKRIYEAKHPETKHGGKRGNQHTGGEKRQVAIFAFCQNAAESTGLSERSVRLAIQIFNDLSRDTRQRLKGSIYAEKQSDLKALAELDAAAQKNVLDLLFVEPPQVTTIADAKLLASGERRESDAEKRFRTVCDYLPNLPKASRLGVFRQHRAEIVELVRKEGWLDE